MFKLNPIYTQEIFVLLNCLVRPFLYHSGWLSAAALLVVRANCAFAISVKHVSLFRGVHIPLFMSSKQYS